MVAWPTLDQSTIVAKLERERDLHMALSSADIWLHNKHWAMLLNGERTS